MRIPFSFHLALVVLAVAIPGFSQTAQQLTAHNVAISGVEYRGRAAIHLTPAPEVANENTLALVAGPAFRDGVIEVEVAGVPAAGAFAGARGFVGVAFRVQPAADKYELIYLRPTNGRAEDQLRRNHSTQYVSFPDWGWQKLREQTPGLYESYVDLEPGVWTKVRIGVRGTTAKLYVHGADQPALVVNDLKAGASQGAIGLWVGSGTEGWFSGLKVSGE